MPKKFISISVLMILAVLAVPGGPAAAQAPGDEALVRSFTYRNLGPFRMGARLSDFAVPGLSGQGPSLDILCRRLDRRPVEDDEQRDDLQAGFRRPEQADDRRRRPGAVEPGHRLGRDRGRVLLPELLRRRRRLQVHRRREDVDRTWGSGIRTTSRGSSSIRGIPTSSMSRRWAISFRRTRSGASSRRPTAAGPGRRSSTVNDKVGVIDLVMDPGHPEILYAAAYDKQRLPWHVRQRRAGERHLQDERRRPELDPARRRASRREDRPDRARISTRRIRRSSTPWSRTPTPVRRRRPRSSRTRPAGSRRGSG